MGKSTISMAIFNSYVKLPEGTSKHKGSVRAQRPNREISLISKWNIDERRSVLPGTKGTQVIFCSIPIPEGHGLDSQPVICSSHHRGHGISRNIYILVYKTIRMPNKWIDNLQI